MGVRALLLLGAASPNTISKVDRVVDYIARWGGFFLFVQMQTNCLPRRQEERKGGVSTL
jgi:hypothetical protein